MTKTSPFSASAFTKSGSFFSYGETRLGQGRNNSKQFLADNPDMADEIEAKIYEALGVARTNGGSARTARPAEEPVATGEADAPAAGAEEEAEAA